MAPREAAQRRGYLLEFQSIGGSVKVSAIDPATLVEVSIVGPSSVSEAELTRVAVRKLEYMLRKRTAQPGGRPGAKARRPGIEV